MASNVFRALDDEVSVKKEDTGQAIKEAVTYAVVTATGVEKAKEAGKGRKEKERGTTSHASAASRGGGGAVDGGLDDGLIANIVTKVLVAIQPIIIQAISSAVTAAMTTVIEQMASKPTMRNVPTGSTDG